MQSRAAGGRGAGAAPSLQLLPSTRAARHPPVSQAEASGAQHCPALRPLRPQRPFQSRPPTEAAPNLGLPLPVSRLPALALTLPPGILSPAAEALSGGDDTLPSSTPVCLCAHFRGQGHPLPSLGLPGAQGAGSGGCGASCSHACVYVCTRARAHTCVHTHVHTRVCTHTVPSHSLHLMRQALRLELRAAGGGARFLAASAQQVRGACGVQQL